MNKSKCSEYLYAQFLIATQNNFTCTELGQLQNGEMAHDSATRLLQREKLTPNILWKNVKSCVSQQRGFLIADDTVLDKAHSQDIQPARWQYSGSHHKVVKGIGLESLLWTNDGDSHLPIDFRIYDKDTDGKTKNQHLQEMLSLAKHRGLNPWYVLFDSWYCSLENLKLIDRLEWKWVSQFKKNRVVSLEAHKNKQLEELSILPEGLVVHLRGYGFVKVFKKTSPNGSFEYFGTNDLSLSSSDVERIYGKRWKIEEYHRGLKQQCGVAKCQARKARSQRNHIWCSIHAFVALELHRLETGTSWQEAKLSIAREAITRYLLAPRFSFEFATA